MKKKLSEIQASNDPYDVKSKKRLEANIARKFKKLFGTALYLFETHAREAIEKDPELHREFKSELFRIGNRLIQNSKKELSCYNVTYVPVTVHMRGPEQTDEE